MGSCTRRHFLLSTCFLQMITIIERQVFDFLGYMWAPICVNLVHIILVIFGFYGAYHLRIKCIISYLIWNILWIGWNAFLICFYLNVGELDRDSDLLNLGTGSVSWFEVNGYGCKPTYPTNITSEDPFRPLRPERVDGCLLDYEIVEVVQAGVQSSLALLGILGAILISCIFLDEDDRFDFVNGDAKSPQHTVVHPVYVSYTSIPTSTSATLQSNKIQQHHNNNLLHNNHHQNHHYNTQQQQQQQQQQPQLQIQQPQLQSQLQLQLQAPQLQPQSLQLQLQQTTKNSLQHHNNINNNKNNNNNHNNNNNNNNNNIKNNKFLINHIDSNSNNNSNSKSQEQANNTNKNCSYLTYTSNNCSNYTTGSFSSGINKIKQQTQTTQLKRSNSNISSSTNFNYNQYNPSSNPSFSRSHSNSRSHSHSHTHSHSNSNTPMSSKNNTLTRVFYNQKSNRLGSSATSITPTPTPTINELQEQHQLQQQQQKAFLYYDDSTAKADQLYTNSNRRQFMSSPTSFTGNSLYQQQQQQNVLTPSSQDNTTSSLSYASLQSSNLYLPQVSGGAGGLVNLKSSLGTPLSNSNYSLCSNNNNTANSRNNNGHFARIHSKPKPPKSTSYSSFVSQNSQGAGTTGNNSYRPEIKYTQMSSERLSRNFDESLEDDNFSLRNFKNDDGITYVPFQKPTPGNLFITKNNNPSYTSLNSFVSTSGNQLNPLNNSSPNQSINNNNNNNNNNTNNNSNNSNTNTNNNGNNNQAPFGILLEHGAILQPVFNPPPPPLLTQADRFLCQQNGLPFHPTYSPTPFRSQSQQPTRPTNIPLPTVPTHSFNMPISPSEVTPPPPPAPRPHIFQPRSGHAPYPDLSPEVTEKYAMPTQYIPRSPVASRIARKQRQQREKEQQEQRSLVASNAAKFCDQIRDAPPSLNDKLGFGIKRTRSQDRLTSSLRDNKGNRDLNAAPHVNRRSGRRDGKVRPRSYCNSMIGGEGVIRSNIAADKEISIGIASNG